MGHKVHKVGHNDARGRIITQNSSKQFERQRLIDGVQGIGGTRSKMNAFVNAFLFSRNEVGTKTKFFKRNEAGTK